MHLNLKIFLTFQKCYDYDKTTSNDLVCSLLIRLIVELGEIELPVAVFVNRAPQEEWRQFQDRKGNVLKPGLRQLTVMITTLGKGELKLSVSYVSSRMVYCCPKIIIW